MLEASHTIQPATVPGLSLENPYCARYALDGQVVHAKQGAMVAYRGDMSIKTKSQGVKNLLKRSVTGEGVALMEVEGRGDIWFADEARNVFLFNVTEGDQYTITGSHVLCFDPTLSYDIKRVEGAGMVGGGLFNCVFSGSGNLAITSHGTPMVIPVGAGQPVFVDTDAVVGWSSGLRSSIRRSEGAKSLLKGGSGELFQLKLEGEGFVIVQPSEGYPIPADSSGGGGVVSNLLGG